MRQLIVSVAVLSVGLSWAAPFATGQTPSTAASARPVTMIGRTMVNASDAQISGRVVSPAGNAIAKVTVRARDLVTGQIAGSTVTSEAGEFAIGVNPGSYVLEAVDQGGQVIGTSSFLSASAGSAMTATITASGSMPTIAPTAGLGSLLSSNTARAITYAAAAAGVAGVVTPAAVVTASPSK